MTDFPGTLGNDLFIFTGVDPFDSYVGGAGIDTLDARSTTGSYNYDLANNFVFEQASNEQAQIFGFEAILAGTGNDVIRDSNTALSVTLNGGGGDDLIQPGIAGLQTGDVFAGGVGFDTFWFAEYVADMRLNLQTGSFQTAFGGPVATVLGFESVFAGAGDDVIGGSSRNEEFYGASGNDTIAGGAGDDFVSGGPDQDLLRGDSGDDTVRGASGNDVVLGGAGADFLYGGQGADTLRGGVGNDDLAGEDGNDVLAGNAGNDTLWGGNGNDWLIGEDGFDRLFGGFGQDRLEGGLQADNLFGDAGVDTLLGGAGFDRLEGGDNNDLLYGGTEGDALFGETGNDLLYGQSGADRLFGGVGNDRLDGGTDNDRLLGGAGFDTLIGSTGNDVMAGNFNADRFVFADFGGGFGQDTITDFAATNDFERIDLSRVTTIVNLFDLLSNHTTQTGANVVIDAGGGNTITLLNVDMGDLDAFDFVF
ncbi:calcium-binding protein [Sulfitobacter aestuariivivens]|uniref:Calcium-binding protein n=1 Tax=Sulfitobacter aestuariivivens TaxID=2766981 RepID=A0A927D3V4_9RHOB|nr:calcium-binding protein [Sulfitobacter aestuariivivens]MBD3663793.1 calcium-binding protein [Sulfitobacter aestuariivivens]